jgi:hypothetical protein
MMTAKTLVPRIIPDQPQNPRLTTFPSLVR